MVVRISILVKKLDTVTLEQFHTYWSESHPTIFLSVPTAREKLLKYSQYHIDAGTTAYARAAQGVTTEMEYDGTAEFWVESLEDFAAIFHDEKYASVVVPDEMSFLDRANSLLLIGHEEVKWENGKPGEGVKL